MTHTHQHTHHHGDNGHHPDHDRVGPHEHSDGS